MIEKLYWSLLGLLLLWNLCTFLMMGIDKRRSKKGAWRISEKTLLLSALVFGGIGAFLGMKIFHHKTKHWYFRLLLPLFVVLQIAAWTYLLIRFGNFNVI